MNDLHPSTTAILRYFDYNHLPPAQRAISKPFGDLAKAMAGALYGPELTAGLRKLLEAKDCCVRASLDLQEYETGGSPLA